MKADCIPFEFPDLLFQEDTDGREEYYPRPESEKEGVVHFGQLKLALALIQILTIVRQEDNFGADDYHIYYIGASPGTNIVPIFNKFPGPTWHLYDTGPIADANSPKYIIHRKYFTSGDVAEIQEKVAAGEKVLFISDIRRSGTNEDLVWEDMQMQQDWFVESGAQIGWLKFRLPYPGELPGVKDNTVEYLNGLPFYGIWAPRSSTETRLLVQSQDIIQWDIKDYESRLFWHNNVRRKEACYIRRIAPSSELSDNWDSSAEVQVLESAFQSFGMHDDILAFHKFLITAMGTSIQAKRRAPLKYTRAKTAYVPRTVPKKPTIPLPTIKPSAQPAILLKDVFAGLEFPLNVDLSKGYTQEDIFGYVTRFIEQGAPYPYQAFYNKTRIPELLQNLLEFEPTWIPLSINGRIPSPFLPTAFRNTTHYLVNEPDTYDSIDILTATFTEDQQIQSKKGYHDKTMAESWADPQIVLEVFQAAAKNFKRLDAKSLADSIYGMKNLKQPGGYLITKARCITQRVFGIQYGANSDELRGKRWLDISAGWGDRMAAAASLGMDYVGFDPNKDLQFGHNKMREALQEAFPKTTQTIHYMPFEDGTNILSKEKPFDIVHTSPPFFTLEIYPGQSQSTSKFPKLEGWLNGFLFPSINLAWSKLKNGGYLCINIEAVEDDKGKMQDIPTMMNVYIKTQVKESSYEGSIPFGNPKVAKLGLGGIVYVWKKKGKKSAKQGKPRRR